MGVENCLQLSTASIAIKSSNTQYLRKSYRKHTNSLTFQGQKTQFLSLSSSIVSTFTTWRSVKTSSFVCNANASNAVNQVREVTGSSWDSEVLGSATPVLVEFWAPWCGPCKMIAPVIEELAKEYSGKIACYKLNTDDSANIATQYNIRSIPTVLFFKNGERKESIIGAVPKSTLTSAIDKYLEA